MWKIVKNGRKMGILGGVAITGGCLVLAPFAAFSASEGQAASAAEGQRSYYFSRTSQPYASYEDWLKDNPRFNHPYHDTIHGPLFSDSKTADPKVSEAKTKPYLNQPAFRAQVPPPYGYSRILWVNDRYYSGKYYPTAKEKGSSAEAESKSK